MSNIVCKFGGTSLCNAAMIRRAADIVQSRSDRRYIILSAPGKRSSSDEKITDLLYRAYRAGSTEDRYIFSQIHKRYAEITEELCPDFPLHDVLSDIWLKLHSSPDFAASRGEYLCARIFSAYSGIPFVDAADLIRFYEDGTLDMQSTQERCLSRLSMLGRAVIPGFYGSMPNGDIKTFSRGGSDVSGAIIAAALSADLYENWTDVDGLFTADPRLIQNARRNPIVSLRQMQKLAHAGANVLHPDSLSVLSGTGIDTLIKNTFSPDAAGTRITESFAGTVPCITGRKNLSIPVLDSLDDICETCVCGEEGCCVISVFGLDSTAMRRIHRRLKHVCIIHMQDHFKIITRNSLYETAVSAIHELL